MKIRSIEIEQVRKFDAPVRVTLADGLNVLAAPNEAGKSTLLAALKAAFLVKYSSRAEQARLLQARNGGAPRVRVEFSADGKECVLEKRFLARSMARLTIGTQNFDSDDAEDQLASMLALESAKRSEWSGMLNVLWVDQGQSLLQPELSDPSRTTLESCLQADIGEITGTAEASRILARVEKDLSQHLNGRNQPTGRYAALIRSEAEADEQIADLARRRRNLEEQLLLLANHRGELAREDDETRRAGWKQSLAEASRRREKLNSFLDRAKAVEAARQANLARQENRRAELALREGRQTDIAKLRRELADLAEQRALDQSAQERIQRDIVRHVAAESAARQAYELARTALLRAQRLASVSPMAVRRAQSSSLLERVEIAHLAEAQARARLLACTLDEEQWRKLQKLGEALDRARSAMNAQATQLDLELEEGAFLRIDGVTVQSGRHALVNATDIFIEKIGHIRIAPAIRDRATLDATVRKAEEALSRALGDLDCTDMRAAEAQREVRRQNESSLRDATLTLHALLAGREKDTTSAIATLRQEISVLDEQVAAALAACGLSVLPADNTDTSHEAALQEQAALGALEQARTPAGEARQQEALLQQRMHNTAGLRDNAQKSLDGLLAKEESASRQEPADALQASLAQLGQEHVRLNEEARMLDAERPDDTVAMLDATIRRHESLIEGQDRNVSELRQAIASLEGQVRQVEGDGIDERIADARRLAAGFAEERAWCEREIAILKRLRDALADAEREASTRYLAPLTKFIQPSLQALFPRARPVIGRNFALTGLMRHGDDDESFASLSDGTREQIAVLVRLGFAELLAAQGHPAMLVLDDALTFSDAQRLERMFDILTEAASRMQILVLTCRSDAFAPLGGHRIAILPAG